TQYANQATEKLTVATQDSRTIIQAAQAALARIWREDIAYAKAGIMLADFSGKEAQLDLFDSATPSAGSEALMAVLDGINRRGKSQLFFAGQGIDNSFAMRRQMLSPDYTTDWRSIPTATIK
ncbi:translesion error-prone DNA polymerase V subunit MucB, partial [Klebsiella pneumoniae]|nr:translesion error-prone DNA polymerase V subunit MucB [Klebsiella pneumoniae]MDA5192277.1 translesion error-prone DNA polymerase V subunit MucB [Klebsiella pneumoniae]